eukprot:SM009662S24923  [mRNA]  locus=s9662:260:490:+ [translate_table: standard]
MALGPGWGLLLRLRDGGLAQPQRAAPPAAARSCDAVLPPLQGGHGRPLSIPRLLPPLLLLQWSALSGFR